MNDDIRPMADPLVSLTQMIVGYQERRRPHLSSPFEVMIVTTISGGLAYCHRTNENATGYGYPWATGTAPVAGNTVLIDNNSRMITRIIS